MANDPASDVDLAPLTSALAKIAEDMARKAVQDALPSLVKTEIGQSLPDQLKPLVEQMAKDIIEKVARDVISATAETEVVKEIERLKAER